MNSKTKGRPWGLILGVGLLLLVVIGIIMWIWFPHVFIGEERDAGRDIVEQTYDSGNALETYEEFRRLYNEIEAQRQEVQNFYAEEEQFHETYGNDPNDWSRQAESRHGDIHTRIAGAQNQLEQLVAEYNTMTDNAHEAVFQCHLPWKVDERFGINGPPGSGSNDEPVDVGPDGGAVDSDSDIPPGEQCDGLPEEIPQGNS